MDHIPFQYRLWIEDLEKQKPYMGLVEGIYSSMFDMKKSQAYADWKDDWFWMLMYFSFGVWFILGM